MRKYKVSLLLIFLFVLGGCSALKFRQRDMLPPGYRGNGKDFAWSDIPPGPMIKTVVKGVYYVPGHTMPFPYLEWPEYDEKNGEVVTQRWYQPKSKD